MPKVFADYPQRHLLATSWALCFRKIYVCHIIIFVCLRSNYECKDTYFFCFSQIFFYLSQSVCEIFPCQCNHSLARSSSILRLSLSAAVISLPKNSWIKKWKTMPWWEQNIGMGGHFLLNSRPLLIAEQNLYNHFPMSAEISSRKVLMHGVRI